jgi:hypothetical protein
MVLTTPSQELPPPSARGRTRTLRQNYFGSRSPDPLLRTQLVCSYESISLASISSTGSLGSAWEAAGAWTTLSLTSTSCRISPSTATSCAALPQPRSNRLLAAIIRAAAGAFWSAVANTARQRAGSSFALVSSAAGSQRKERGGVFYSSQVLTVIATTVGWRQQLSATPL